MRDQTPPATGEPAKGEHWSDAFGLTPWIVNNPCWPSGDGAYLVLCGGCKQCLRGEDAY